MAYDSNGEWIGGRDDNSDPSPDRGNSTIGGTPQLPWWQDPNSRPAYWPADQPWPPPLPPGGSYGEQPGQINYAPGTGPSLGGSHNAPPAPAAGPTGPANPNTPPTLGTFTPPPMLDLGGPAGLSYIPPTPQFQTPQFQAPSVADAMADPGQQFRMQQGERALQNWAGAKGTLNDSSTAKALEDYGQASGAQGYADVWNRDWNVYTGSTLPGWLAGTVNPGMQGFQTKASAGEFQNNQNYLNAWNAFVNSQNNAKWFADHA